MPSPGLKIKLAIDPARARLWHRRLADQLRDHGHQVSIELRPGGPRPPKTIGFIMQLERLLQRRGGESLASHWAGDALTSVAKPGPDPELEIDLTGNREGAATPRTLRPVYGAGVAEEDAVYDLLSGRIPEVGVADSAAPGHPLMTRPAIEDRLNLTSALDNLGARLATILVRAADIAARGGRSAGKDAIALRDATAWTAAGALAALSQKAMHFLNKMLRRGPHWYVGWRHAEADRLSETLTMPASGWTRLPDDGGRFYADPIVVPHQGRTWVFVEEFPYATGKGIISAVEIGPDGPIGRPEPVLELPHHASYPFIFEQDGAVWMIPETSSARSVDLYRATDFPRGWVHEARLLDDVEVSDATILQMPDRLWMFGTVSGAGGSSWDALHLWSSTALRRGWTAHFENPVLIDALGARPAGALYFRGGQLWRPAQDCTSGYGVGLALCRVTKLDDEGFDQTIEAVIRPGGAWPGIGLHSLNWAGGIEVVDGCQDRG